MKRFHVLLKFIINGLDFSILDQEVYIPSTIGTPVKTVTFLITAALFRKILLMAFSDTIYDVSLVNDILV